MGENSTINSRQDYSSLFWVGETASSDSPSIRDSGNSKTQNVKKEKNPVVKKTRNQVIQKSVRQELKATGDKEDKISRGQEVKKSRVIIDSDGNSRRPANITIQDDVKQALDILAIKRRTRPWKLIDIALREYLEREGELKKHK